MIKNKKIIIIIIIIIVVVVVGFVVYRLFIKNNEPEIVLGKVVRGTVSKEISETGAVKISEEINLGFKYAGRIEEIYVKVGDEISSGQSLAKLDTSQLLIELQQAQTSFELAKAKKADVQVSLDNARQSLRDIEIDATEDLKQAYENSLSVLDEAYLKIYNAFNLVNSIQVSYFVYNDQEGIKVRSSKEKIQNALNQTKAYIDNLKPDYRYEKIDTVLAVVRKALEETKEALEVVRDMAETINYRDKLSSTDKTSLDNQKSYITTAQTNIVGSQQTLSTTKITNETNINVAKAKILTLEAQLKEEGLYQAQINQANTEILLLEDKIREVVLKSSDSGQLTKVNKRKGELVQPTDSVISFLPTGPFQIEADIYEEDIVNVKIGNPVKITLAAFPERVLRGKVASIDPAEKIINNVVYYEVNITFEKPEEGIKPGMTADIVIEGERKENVLVISKNALEKRDSKKIVKVFRDGQVEEREIETGLEGSNNLVEVVSGLSEGEEILTGIK